MKKILSVLALITILGASVPAFAAPPPPPAHGGAHYRHEMRRPPHHHGGGHFRPHSGFVIHTGFPRYDYYHAGISGYPYCRCPYCMAHRPISGASFYIRF